MHFVITDRKTGKDHYVRADELHRYAGSKHYKISVATKPLEFSFLAKEVKR